MTQVLKADWSKIADGTATGIILYNTGVFPVKEGFIWEAGFWVKNLTPEVDKIIAVRPKPPLTNEQKQAIRDFAEWFFDGSDTKVVENYFKELENE